MVPSMILRPSGSTPSTRPVSAALKSPLRNASVGTVPSPKDWPSGCKFRDRCPYAFDRCAVEEPALLQIGSAHRARCHLVEEPEKRVPRPDRIA